jgi:hypothetical protein
MTIKNKTLYSVQICPKDEIYSRTLFRQLVQKRRAARVANWLQRRGHDAFIAPVLVRWME